MKQRKSKKQKAVIALSGAVALMCIISIVIGYLNPRSVNHTDAPVPTVTAQPGDKSPSRSSPPKQVQPSAVPTPPSGPADQGSSLNPDGPVAAAKKALETLESAAFLPRTQAAKVAEQLVAPSVLEDEKLTLYYRGVALASPDNLNYESVAEAHKWANYTFVALMYYPNKTTKNSAKITLYGAQGWRTPPNKEGVQNGHLSPYMQVVYMKRVKVRSGRKWLFVRQEEPPVGWQPPLPQDKITYARATKHFAPYLKKFKDIYDTNE